MENKFEPEKKVFKGINEVIEYMKDHSNEIIILDEASQSFDRHGKDKLSLEIMNILNKMNPSRMKYAKRGKQE